LRAVSISNLSFTSLCGIIVNMEEYTITIAFDEEASVWYALNDDIPIALESDSIDVLIERVKLAVPELLELNGKNKASFLKNFICKHGEIQLHRFIALQTVLRI